MSGDGWGGPAEASRSKVLLHDFMCAGPLVLLILF